jgi:hypothetical protein
LKNSVNLKAINNFKDDLSQFKKQTLNKPKPIFDKSLFDLLLFGDEESWRQCSPGKTKKEYSLSQSLQLFFLTNLFILGRQCRNNCLLFLAPDC